MSELNRPSLFCRQLTTPAASWFKGWDALRRDGAHHNTYYSNFCARLTCRPLPSAYPRTLRRPRLRQSSPSSLAYRLDSLGLGPLSESSPAYSFGCLGYL